MTKIRQVHVWSKEVNRVSGCPSSIYRKGHWLINHGCGYENILNNMKRGVSQRRAEQPGVPVSSVTLIHMKSLNPAIFYSSIFIYLVCQSQFRSLYTHSHQ